MTTPSPLEWTADGQPRSRLFGDVYFSAEDGLAESRAVFLQGCGLPGAWAGRRRFVVGELGFGTGLNIAALLDLWSRSRPAGGQLHIFSVEAFPISAEEAARALARWPELAAVSSLLTARWPGRARGVHRIELPEVSAIVDVAVQEVGPALAGWSGRADAWFLDGFAPAANPDMWTDEILALVGARSAPGARAATFTVAGQVRRGLAAAGFTVEKRPGFGRKRERLEALLPGFASDPPFPRVASVGAGSAGAAAARAVRALGGAPVLIEADGPGAGASGNPAALVTPRLDAGLGDTAQLFARAFGRAVALYRSLPGAVVSAGVRQLGMAERDPDRFARVAASDLFEPGTLALADPAVLELTEALAVEPAAILDAWAAEVRRAVVGGLTREGAAWRLLDGEGGVIAEAEVVILCAGLASRDLVAGLPLSAVRGQASWTTQWAGDVQASAWGGYVLPAGQGVLFGATHDRDDEAVDVRPGDHQRNLQTLAVAFPDMARARADAPLQGRAGIRAVTPDRLPLAGPLGEGLFVLAGFGGRGFSLAPLLAEHVAALALGAPSPLPLGQAELVDPARFTRRAARRGGS